MTPHYSRRGKEALERGECVDPESYDVGDLRAGTIEEGKTVHPPHSRETVSAVVSELRGLEQKRSA